MTGGSNTLYSLNSCKRKEYGLGTSVHSGWARQVAELQHWARTDVVPIIVFVVVLLRQGLSL